MKNHIYTPEEAAFLKSNIKGRSVKELTQMFNAHFGLCLSRTRIRAAVKNRGLTNGIDCRFSKGHIPANKGKKGMGGWEPTQFKKGHVPVGYRSVGSERITVDGYIEIKTADPKTWREKHVVVWEKENGPVPKGYALLFADGNRQNTDIENLILVSRRQLAVLNHKGLLQKDKQLNETALLITDLILKIAEVRKKRQ